MSDARTEIFGKIHKAIGRTQDNASSSEEAVKSRLAKPPTHPRPTPPKDLVARFTGQLTGAGASVQRLASRGAVVETVCDYLRQENLPSELVVAGDEVLDTMHWPPTVTIHRRPACDTDKVSLTGAVIGVAETGSLMLLSGKVSPTTLNFLPDHHLVVLREDALVAGFEEAWSTLRSRYGQLPRTVNLISGPSKTADVEQTIQQGAHGPRQLVVMIVP